MKVRYTGWNVEQSSKDEIIKLLGKLPDNSTDVESFIYHQSGILAELPTTQKLKAVKLVSKPGKIAHIVVAVSGFTARPCNTVYCTPVWLSDKTTIVEKITMVSDINSAIVHDSPNALDGYIVTDIDIDLNVTTVVRYIDDNQ